MISEEYVYIGQTMEISIHDPLYRPEVDITPLLVGYLTVEPKSIPDDIWQEFAEDVFDGSQDPQFKDHKQPASWNDIHLFARKLSHSPQQSCNFILLHELTS